MKIKGERTLKNGAKAGYVYYPKDKKWKWRKEIEEDIENMEHPHTNNNTNNDYFN